MGSAMSTGRSRTLVNPPRAPASPSSSSPAALTGPGAAGSSLEGVRIGMLWASTSRRTPGAPSPGGYNPHTPGSGIEQSSSDWVTTDIQVKVRDTYRDSQAVGQTGIIRSVMGGMCSIYLYDSEKVVSISSEHLEPVTPTRRNKVKVILGEDREATGILLSIDGEDGIVRMDLEKKLKIFNLCSLSKLVKA
ncbi:transcription elongation factor SPT5-like isoform X1 [Strix uralensis]|uniref:transcription elongation factor SPT5-like isoform X1 n=1 Tax=Strix uralensis TaxID=36305 RepID=UPI003DA6755D